MDTEVTKRMIDFVGHRKIFYGISAGLVALVVILSLVLGVQLDISFKGGCMVTYSATQEISSGDVDKAVESAIHETVSVQTSQDIKTGKQSIIVTLVGTKSLSTDQQADMTAAMEKAFPDAGIQVEGTTNVDASMGMEFLLKCVIAVVMASILMLIYIGLRFRKIGGMSAGCMAVVALLHDTMMVYAAFVIFRFPLDSNFIAAILTILGYSINDTIVIYDRVRENERLYGRGLDNAQLINKSVNQSLTRTVHTTVTTVIALLVVSIVALIFRVNSILTFTVPLIVGMASGLYTSTCLTTTLWYSWQEHKAKTKANSR